ncbi:NACHT domain-containing protein [Streptomyces sp. NBC_00879]|uniref:NACHT domain-containing protein n=1 Tax=Streptomyces sp. NBC_00879 TaxID=2975855 RepID=UPI003862DD69|nr:NACHT domain-containing protein [Streptomyces sp. NBC_00879]
MGLPLAFLAWKAFYHDRVEAAALDLGTVADQLAQAVQKQWDHEAATRRMNDPYPLPVAWRPADADLVEAWPLLAEVAQSWPGGPPGDPAQWPEEVAGLAGAAAEIGEVFTQLVPTRRLVVLGEPGSGKTMLLVRLLQDLIEQRSEGGSVPVLVSLASWDPRQPLEGWLAEQLRRSHPGLRLPAPATMPGADAIDLAQALLDTRLILPLLDGFDELPPAMHPLALSALNRALPTKQPVVLASRVIAYRTAVQRPDVMVRLNGAAGIHLLPLIPEQAAAYLRRDAGGEDSAAADRWTTAAIHLGTDTPVGQALSTPLGLFLARTIYNPRPYISAAPAPIPHPDELCDTTAFPTRAALDAHLFNAFIPAAYTPHHPHPPHWPVPRAYRTLAFLARHLETNRDSSPDLAWWELHQALPGPSRHLMVRLAAGLTAGLTAGLAAGLTFRLTVGLAAGLAAALAFGLAGGLTCGFASAPSTQLRWSSGTLATRLAFGLAFGLAAGFAGGLAAGLAAGLAIGLTVGLTTEKPDLTTVIGPATLLTQDRRTYVVGGLTAGLAAGFAAGLVAGLAAGIAFGIAVGIAFGLMIGLVGGLSQTAWGGLVIARSYLAVRRKVPWDLMAFLQDAHEHRGVLRQTGAVYQFRHLDLQRHLAQQPWPPEPDRRLDRSSPT